MKQNTTLTNRYMAMKVFYSIITLLVFCSFSVELSAQKKELKRARQFYDDGEYYRSQEYYDALVKVFEYELPLEDKIRYAKTYYYLNDIDEANKRLSLLESSLTGEDIFIYASTLHRHKDYENAIEWYKRAKDSGANILHVNDLIESCEWAIEHRFTYKDFRVNPCFELATQGQSFGVQYYQGKVVYSSAVNGNSKNKDRSGNAFLNLYMSDIDKGEVVENTKVPFSKNLMSKYHVGAICFTSDFKYIYYTKSIVVDDYDIMKIFVSEYDGKEWVNEQELPFNSDKYDCAHPALTPDDKYLYFVSNRDDIGYGGKDIYFVERYGPNSFGEVVNAGKNINTYGDEVYPVISKDYKLYFSSNVHKGFGGLDIFKADYVDGQWTNVENMMQPFNSNYDDFCYVIDPDDPNRGFLSSNNYQDNNKDVIFTVRKMTEDDEKIQVEDMPPIMGMETLVFNQEELEGMPEDELQEPEVIEEPQEFVEAPVVAAHPFYTEITSTFNDEKVIEAQLIIADAATGETIASGFSDKTGVVKFDIRGDKVNENSDYNVTVKKSGYKTKTFVASLEELDELRQTGIKLTPIFNNTVLEDIGGMVIPYKNDLDEEAKVLLDKLAAYLTQNPSVVIKLNAHTEAKGVRYKNLSISQKMAEKAQTYLASQGVSEDQVIPRGYGERYLLNRCHRGKYCDLEQHLENRRIEVVVWDIRK